MSKKQIIRPKKIRLYNAINIGYLRNEQKQKKRLKKFGYVLDNELTNRERLVAWNPYNKKLLYVENGTDPTNEGDLAMDLLVGLGASKNTKRVEEAKNALLKAKKKYNVPSATLVSHSLGGNITHYIANEGDKVVSYNPALINQKVKKNETIYRTEGDVFSSYTNNANTLKAPDKPSDSTFFKSHTISNIKTEPIFL
jgi:hypothetical protein